MFGQGPFPGGVFGRGRTPGSGTFGLNITGLSSDSIGSYAQSGNHAAIGYAMIPPSGSETVKWSNSANPADAATYGTGASPTAFTTGVLHLHVTLGLVTVSRSVAIRYAPGVAPSISAQTWTVDDTTVNLAGAATGTGLTFTYAATGLPAGVSINPSTGQFTGTVTAVSSSTVNVTPTDQYGRTVPYSFSQTSALRPPATAANAIGEQSWTVDVTNTTLDVGTDFTANGNTLTFSGSNLPAGVTVNPSTGVLTIQPTAVLTSSASVTGVDEYGRAVTSTFPQSTSLRAQATATNATLPTWTEGVAITPYDLTRNFDLKGNTGSFSVFSLPAGISVASTDILGTPTTPGSGQHSIVFTDAYGRTTTSIESWTIAVAPTVPPAPNLSALIIDNDAGTVSYELTPAARVYWMVVTLATADPTADAINTGGEVASGFFDAADGANDLLVENVFAENVDDTFKLAMVARIEPDGEWSLVRVAEIVVNTITESWSITPGETTATVNNFPAAPTTPAWAITPGETTATVTAYPGQPA